MKTVYPASVLLAVSVGACDAAREPVVTRQPEAEAVAHARVDTIRGRLDDWSYAGLRRASPAAGDAVLLVLNGGDISTCEDLGRQARELQRWAASRGARLVIWSAGDSSIPVTAFLRREKLGVASVIHADSLPRLQHPLAIATPAALLVEAGGSVRGTAHPDRVPNVRTRSFADELEELLRARDGAASAPPNGPLAPYDRTANDSWWAGSEPPR